MSAPAQTGNTAPPAPAVSRAQTFQLCAAAWLSSRLFLAVLAYAGQLWRGGAPLRAGAWEGVSDPWLQAWTTYDSRFYLDIAAHGYTPQTSVFFPLYPLLLRPFGPNASALAVAGIALSNLAFAGALWLLFEVTQREYGAPSARLAVWIAAFFPCAAFGAAVYSESLWLLLGLALWKSARNGPWIEAGLWGILAALTRNTGPVLTLALLIQWWQTRQSAEAQSSRQSAERQSAERQSAERQSAERQSAERYEPQQNAETQSAEQENARRARAIGHIINRNADRQSSAGRSTISPHSIRRDAPRRSGAGLELLSVLGPGLTFIAVQLGFRTRYGDVLASVAGQSQFGARAEFSSAHAVGRFAGVF